MIEIYQVDSFTDRAFRGNPAAVCWLPGMPDDDWMQNVAAEMNLSETAFLVPENSGHRLRWFTPTVEVELCGHATLAAAQVLRLLRKVGADETAVFHTRSGELRASFDGPRILLDFPATPPEACTPPAALKSAIDLEPQWVGKTRFDYLIQAADANQVRTCEPDFAVLRGLGVRGVMVTALSDQEQFDFISRYFAPGAGIDEDPVTGSAHCALAPFWGEQLGKQEMTGYQASRRGGIVHTRLESDRVQLSGEAVTVMRCELLIDG